ncbi:methyltransferase domain-containing protein [uncultured Methanobrevibacter sp.]|uniref:methyltransferase domain-containing protein n=1 Tax=uncultured Methanobrevibacter sp. TaxID=253161 RepID=UPI0025CF9C90|nr:methyltransferase domain-containing protein [uncultured Methanobrevibacter sp.]
MSKYDYNYMIKKNKPDQKEQFFECVIEELFNNADFKGYECPVCGEKFPMFLPFSRRKKAFCPNCESLERQRLIAYYFKNYTDIFSKPVKLLHFAPEPGLYNLFNNCSSIDYLPVDLELRYCVKEQVDMCSIQYGDNSFDVIYNSHVLEHVVDDVKALNELYRCVKPASEGGYVVIVIPLFRNMDYTLEKAEYNTPELRLKYYGQEDHLRKYGLDFKDKLIAVGFDVDELICGDFVNDDLIKKYGLIPTETIYVCKKRI